LQRSNPVKWKELDMTIFLVIRKQLQGAVFLGGEMDSYIEFEYVHRSTNYYENDPKKRHIFRKFPARQCGEEDFGKDPRA